VRRPRGPGWCWNLCGKLTLFLADGAILLAITAGLFVQESAAAQPVSQLSAVRAASHSGYDRVVFQFTGPVPPGHSVNWVSEVSRDASGKALPLRGRAFLRVVFKPATARSAAGQPTYKPSPPVQFDLPVLRSVKPAGDFENVLSFGVGLRQKTPLHVFTLSAPARLVIDMAVPATRP
jgi:hypothetical protein